MAKEFRELSPPRMFPRTEGQAKAMLAVIAVVIAAALTYLLVYGFSLRTLFSE
jgi:hypothetical protein